MKNRRKCKNKYREKELEVRKADTATESTAGEQQKEDTQSGDDAKETSSQDGITKQGQAKEP